jgi:hypothetical protein
MFAIHQRIRRRICQTGFCLLCALPTTGLLAWTTTLKTAGHANRCQQDLSEMLGMQSRFRGVRYPQPGQSLYEDFELVDAETGQWVMRCRTLGVTRTGRKLVLEPGDMELSADQAQKLVRLFMRRLTRELPSEKSICLVPSSVTLHSEVTEQTYDDVEGRLESQTDQSTATLSFRLPDARSGEPPMLSVVRMTSSKGVKTIVKLDTMNSVLPSSVFTHWLDLQPLLGDDATFRGSLTVEATANGWSGELTGVLTEVDLDRLVASRFPHHLNGRANILIESSRIHNGKLIEASGQILSERGTIGGSLLVAAVELLGCPAGAAPPGRLPFANDTNYPYRDLSVEFAVDEQGLLLTASPDAPSGAIVFHERGEKLLAAPLSGPAPLIQLVKALVPESAVQVPATKETAALVPWLPLPPIVPPRDEQSLRSPPLRAE